MAKREKFTTQQIIDALRDAKGMVYIAAQRLGCDAKTIYNYRDRHTAVRAEMEHQDGLVDDAAEMKLYQAIMAGESWAVQFRLRTKAKHRGYSERSQVEVTGPDGGAIRSDTTVTHTFDTDKAKEVLDILTLAGAFDVATEADSKSLDGAQPDA